MTWTGSGENIGARKDGRNWPALARFERSCAILLEGSERRKDICLTKVERGIEILVSLVGYREGIYTGVVCYPKYTKCGKSRAIWEGYCYSSQVGESVVGEISFHNLFIDYQFFVDIFSISTILQRFFYIPERGRII